MPAFSLQVSSFSSDSPAAETDNAAFPEPGTPIDSGVTIAASSMREFKLGNVRTGGHAAQPSRGRYDMV